MPAQTIRNLLISDKTDRTAADVRTANPNVFASDDDVPVHLYQSLKTIMFSTASDPQFEARVVYSYGRGATSSDADIQIIPMEMESITGSGIMEQILSDVPGAETAHVLIYLRLPIPVESASFNKIRSAELRIRYLLDYNLRRAHGLSDLDTSGDNTLFNTYFKSFWKRVLNPPNEAALAVEYIVQYQRAFGK